jgi:hypothetical protein
MDDHSRIAGVPKKMPQLGRSQLKLQFASSRLHAPRPGRKGPADHQSRARLARDLAHQPSAAMREFPSLRAEEQAMDHDATKDRVRADMEAEFLPDPSPDTLSQVDRRMANAAEYIAYHLGQIDKKLDRLITLLEAAAQRPH